EGHAPNSFLPGPCGHCVVVVREHERKQQAVQAVEDATVSRDNPARVFRTESALEGGLAEIAELGEHTDRNRDPERLPEGQLVEEDQPAERSDDGGAHEPPYGALDRLARAHAGQERAAATHPT